MKTLITHINPHLDDISAIWIFKKFHTEFKDAEIEFINASRDEAVKNESPDEQSSSPSKIYFGTGGGKYDEHKGDLEDCAASLVWKDIKSSGLAPQSETELQALDDLIEWNRLIDLGKAKDADFGPYGVQAFIRSKNSTQEDSLKSLRLGEEILDRIFGLLLKIKQSEKDWESRVEFETKFGKSVAIKSETIDRGFVRGKGFNLVLIYDPAHSSAQFFTPSFEIDLEPIYKKVTEVEPGSGWFLHQSHHMVICGSSSAPEHKTNLGFDKLIEIAKMA